MLLVPPKSTPALWPVSSSVAMHLEGLPFAQLSPAIPNVIRPHHPVSCHKAHSLLRMSWMPPACLTTHSVPGGKQEHTSRITCCDYLYLRERRDPCDEGYL